MSGARGFHQPIDGLREQVLVARLCLRELNLAVQVEQKRAKRRRLRRRRGITTELSNEIPDFGTIRNKSLRRRSGDLGHQWLDVGRDGRGEIG